MANYDSPGVLYDGGVLYDAAISPPPTQRKRMAKIKLDLSHRSVEDKITLGGNIKTNMTTNVTVFATPNPSLASYSTVITALTAKNATAVSLRSQLSVAMTDRDVAEKAFDVNTTQLASYVDNIANGDPVKIGRRAWG